MTSKPRVKRKQLLAEADPIPEKKVTGKEDWLISQWLAAVVKANQEDPDNPEDRVRIFSYKADIRQLAIALYFCEEDRTLELAEDQLLIGRTHPVSYNCDTRTDFNNNILVDHIIEIDIVKNAGYNMTDNPGLEIHSLIDYLQDSLVRCIQEITDGQKYILGCEILLIDVAGLQRDVAARFRIKFST